MHAAIGSGVTRNLSLHKLREFFGGKQFARRLTVDAPHCKRVRALRQSQQRQVAMIFNKLIFGYRQFRSTALCGALYSAKR